MHGQQNIKKKDVFREMIAVTVTDRHMENINALCGQNAGGFLVCLLVNIVDTLI